MGGDETKEVALHSAQRSAAPEAPEALEMLFQEHHERVFRAAYRVTGNASDAEDVLQTVFLRLARREGDLGIGETSAGYFHRAAVNAGLDLLRARRRSRTVDLESVEGADGARSSELPGQGRLELRDSLRAALAGLSPKAAEIFTLRYVEGYGNNEIARMIGATRTTVAVVLHRARHRLRKELSPVKGAAS